MYERLSVPKRKTFKLKPGVEAQVLGLARRGFSVAEISQHMQLGTRIVEHIVNSRSAGGVLLPARRLNR